MSVDCSTPVTPVVTGVSVSNDEFGNFMAVFPELVKDLTDTSLKLNMPDATEWLENVCANGFVLLLYYLYIQYTYTYIYKFCSIVAVAIQRARR